MPRFKIFVRFELINEKNEISHEAHEEEVDLPNVNSVEKFLTSQISEKISTYSARSLQWKVVEKEAKELQ